MTTEDYQPFVVEFTRMSAALEKYRLQPQEVNRKADAYFHVLKRFVLSDVIAKADTWLAHESRMPKPAEWAGVVPRRVVDTTHLRTMTDAESRAYHRAEALFYADVSCACALCIHAGVSDRPLRFVPDVDADGRDVKVRDGLRDRIVTAGHWAHGAELAGYYRGRDQFFGRFKRLMAAKTMETRKRPAFATRLDQIFAPRPRPIANREPGEEG